MPRPDWKLDGVNVLPFLTGAKNGPPHDMLFWRSGFRPTNPCDIAGQYAKAIGNS